MSSYLDPRSFPYAGFSAADGPGYPIRGPIVYYEDFLDVGQGEFSATANVGAFLVTGLNAVAGNFTVATGEEGGAIVNTTTTGAADASCAQVCGTSFLCQATTAGLNGRARNMRFMARAKTATITSATQIYGMHITGSADFATTQANGFEFIVANGVVQFRVKNAGGTTAATATGHANIAINVYNTFEITMDSNNALNFYVNGIKATSSAAINVTANVPTGLALSPGFAVLNASAVAKVQTVDKLFCSVEGIYGGFV